jgi:hypothetical protein
LRAPAAATSAAERGNAERLKAGREERRRENDDGDFEGVNAQPAFSVGDNRQHDDDLGGEGEPDEPMATAN